MMVASLDSVGEVAGAAGLLADDGRSGFYGVGLGRSAVH